MEIRGINYDVGVVVSTAEARGNFDPEVAKREFEIIRDSLKCNSVRLVGAVPEVMYQVGRIAAQMGLNVWFTPYLTEMTVEEEKDYMVSGAVLAERLRTEFPDVEVVFVQGGEYPLFVKGILPGETLEERIKDPNWYLKLAEIDVKEKYRYAVKYVADAVREVFHGKVTYAAIPGIEDPDWTLFDYVAVDHYKASYTEQYYVPLLKQLSVWNKPIIVMEVGCATFRGAYEMGSNAHSIMNLETWTIDGEYQRDEELQAQKLESALEDINTSQCVEGIFVFTFCWRHHYVDESNCHNDLDMASYGIVKPFRNREGSTFPGVKWEPKKSFYVVKKFYEGYVSDTINKREG